MSARKARQRRGHSRPHVRRLSLPVAGFDGEGADFLAMALGLAPCALCGQPRVLRAPQELTEPEDVARLAEVTDTIGAPAYVAICDRCGSIGFIGGWL